MRWTIMRTRPYPSSGRTAGRAARSIRRKRERVDNRVQWLRLACAYSLMWCAFAMTLGVQ